MRFPLLVIVCALSAFFIPLGFGLFEPEITRQFWGLAKDGAEQPATDYLHIVMTVFNVDILVGLGLMLVTFVTHFFNVMAAEYYGVRTITGPKSISIVETDPNCPPYLRRFIRVMRSITYGLGSIVAVIFIVIKWFILPRYA